METRSPTHRDSEVAKRALDALLRRRAARAEWEQRNTRIPVWRREERWHDVNELEASFTYSFDDDATTLPLAVRESHEAVGCRVWDGAMLCSKYLERERANPGGYFAAALNRADAHRSVVVELGAGTGLVGLVVASLLGQVTTPTPSVVLTDLPLLLPRLRDSVARNASVASTVSVRPLVWGNAGHAADLLASMGREGSWLAAGDLVVASDLAAPIKHVADLMMTLRALMPPPSLTEPSTTTRPAGCNGAAPVHGCTDFTPTTLLARTAASLAGVGPLLLLCCQAEREFTPPLLEALIAVYAVSKVPVEELHPAYTSAKHAIYLVSPWRHQ